MKLSRTDGLPVPDGIVTVTYLGVELEVGYEVLEPNESVGIDYVPMWALVKGVDVSLLINEIPDAWDDIAAEIYELIEGVF